MPLAWRRVGGKPRAGDEGPASHPRRPCWGNLLPIPHNPHCPKKLSSVISCHRQISCPCLCVAKNLLTLVTPGDSQGQAPCAVCYLLEQVFRFPSDSQKPSIFPLTNWQYLPGLGVGNSSCFSSFQTMCWTVHSKIHTSGAAKTFLSPISLLRDKTQPHFWNSKEFPRAAGLLVSLKGR